MTQPVKTDITVMLSLDTLNFVLVEDFSYYLKWKNVGIEHLFDIIDKVRKYAKLVTF